MEIKCHFPEMSRRLKKHFPLKVKMCLLKKII